ncbi:mitochondrial 37S ribosomal protein PET123 [Sugiyamaella lignohabitans]|uniref:Mitochondrial 37S ribosomal protein PET123 n=1 Tax=Sugiyamaella lignohabitans TaxID=796027 RepID=A0A167FSA8_9ASCO|nr:mitochondrial 37S ribosomal protein PET123 [Sugiyamaella lignohabitans]ANB15639.1 mitochondrial 37S ribosomal protein PET123 [Sugiyamaella lignohabitans]
MVKGIAKYGFKSGFLPHPRQILPKLKTSWEIEEEAKRTVAFEDPAMAPKGSSPNPPPRRQVTASEKLSKSAKPPTKPKSLNTELQQWKAEQSLIRRKYFVDAIEAQQTMDKKELQIRERQFREAAERRQQISTEHTESEAERLTLPSIDSVFNEPFVIPRTPEETEELRLKRTANRKTLELRNSERKASILLELYQSTSNYVITEEDLDKLVQKEFVTNKGDQSRDPRVPYVTGSDTRQEFASTFGSSVYYDSSSQAIDSIKQELLGTTSSMKPGLGEVEDALSGRTQQWKETSHDSR